MRVPKRTMFALALGVMLGLGVGISRGAGGTGQGGDQTPGSNTVIAQNVVVPINRTGSYTWTSPDVQFDHLPNAFIYKYKIDGTAVTDGRVTFTPIQTATGFKVTVQFNVASYEPGADVHIVDIELQDGGD